MKLFGMKKNPYYFGWMKIMVIVCCFVKLLVIVNVCCDGTIWDEYNLNYFGWKKIMVAVCCFI